MGITNASTSDGAAAVQWADNGTNDHLWTFYKVSDGYYAIKNVNSGLYLQSDASGVITQGALATASKLQEWAVTATADLSYPLPMTVTGSGIFVHDPDMIQDTSRYLLALRDAQHVGQLDRHGQFHGGQRG